MVLFTKHPRAKQTRGTYYSYQRRISAHRAARDILALPSQHPYLRVPDVSEFTFIYICTSRVYLTKVDAPNEKLITRHGFALSSLHPPFIESRFICSF